MTASWEKGYDPGLLLSRIATITQVSGGKASLSGLDASDHLAVLHSMVRIDAELPSAIKDQLISKGLFEAIARPGFGPGEVLEAIKRQVRQHLAKLEVPFVLLTSINVARNTILPNLRRAGSSVSFPKAVGKQFEGARSSVIRDASWLSNGGESFQTHVRVRLTAKSSNEAGSRALDAIDLVRGIWNILSNSAWRSSFGGPPKPVNQFMLGALHTLHHEDGSSVAEAFWYEPHHFSQAPFAEVKPNLLPVSLAFRQRLSRLPYQAEIEAAIVRYARALDADDYETAFVKLWGVLELVTDTGLSTYDTTIRRASFMVKESNYHRLVLQHLRQHRNRSVHGGQLSAIAETELFQLKRYVEYVIRFHVGNPFGFKTLEEACKFMDLPSDPVVLKARMDTLRKGLKYLGA